MDSPSSSDDADSRRSALITVEEPAGLQEKFIISMFLNVNMPLCIPG